MALPALGEVVEKQERDNASRNGAIDPALGSSAAVAATEVTRGDWLCLPGNEATKGQFCR